jgi:hypothetical protein
VGVSSPPDAALEARPAQFIEREKSTVIPASALSKQVCRRKFVLPTVDSRAAVANDGHNRTVRNADCVFYGLNSLFREIVFPVPWKNIPCSTKLNSLFRAKKFPVNLTGNLPENA